MIAFCSSCRTTVFTSKWVATEITRAYAREIESASRVLFPISLTHYSLLSHWELFDADHGTDLARYIRQFYIPDFSDWRSDSAFEEKVTKLVSDLNSAGSQEAHDSGGREA